MAGSRITLAGVVASCWRLLLLLLGSGASDVLRTADAASSSDRGVQGVDADDGGTSSILSPAPSAFRQHGHCHHGHYHQTTHHGHIPHHHLHHHQDDSPPAGSPSQSSDAADQGSPHAYHHHHRYHHHDVDDSSSFTPNPAPHHHRFSRHGHHAYAPAGAPHQLRLSPRLALHHRYHPHPRNHSPTPSPSPPPSLATSLYSGRMSHATMIFVCFVVVLFLG